MKTQLKEIQKLLEKMDILKDEIVQEGQDIIQLRNEKFEEHSEKWQESEKGEQWQETTDEIESLIDDFNSSIGYAITELEQIENL
jgi:DNA-binding transcriptional MerR regulator